MGTAFAFAHPPLAIDIVADECLNTGTTLKGKLQRAMSPSSWKSEVQKAVKEATAADNEKRMAEERKSSANISTAIDALREAQKTLTDHEDTNDQKNRTISKITLGLVALTVLFTGLSWYVFRSQLNEMQAEQRPWVYATDIEPAGRIVFADRLYAVPLRFSIKNTGHLPAFFVVQSR